MNKGYYTVISVNSEMEDIFKKYNTNFLTSSISFLLEELKKEKELNICLKIKDKEEFHYKRLLVDKSKLKELKKVAKDNKVSLTSLLYYAVREYDRFINE
jgi:hypothetical protein